MVGGTALQLFDWIELAWIEARFGPRNSGVSPPIACADRTIIAVSAAMWAEEMEQIQMLYGTGVLRGCLQMAEQTAVPGEPMLPMATAELATVSYNLVILLRADGTHSKIGCVAEQLS